MKKHLVFVVALATITWPAIVRAEALPYAALKKTNSVATPLGTFTLQGWGNRDKFPALAETAGVTATNNADGSIRWEINGSHGASATVGDAVLGFHTNGRATWEPVYNWMPVLIFAPKTAGTYAIRGTLNLYTGKVSQDESKPDAIAWAVFRLHDKAVTVIADGRYADKATVSLGEQDKLQEIQLAAGERLGLTVWRPVWHWYSGGKLTGLEVEKVK